MALMARSRLPRAECMFCPPGTIRCVHYGERWLCLHEVNHVGRGLFICAGEGLQLFNETGHWGEARESIANIPVAELPAALAVFAEAERLLMAGAASLFTHA